MERIVKARVEAQGWYTRYPRALPLAVFALTMAVTLLSLASVNRADTESAHARMRALAGGVAAGLERRASANVAYLRAGAILFEEDGPIDTARFEGYVSQFLADPGFRSSEGIGWAEYVREQDVGRFEARRRRAGDRGFTVHPRGGTGGELEVITQLAPRSARNMRAMGFDMYSEPVRRQAMDAARRDGQPVATGRLVLVQEGPHGMRPGFIVYMPVFSARGGHDLKGFVYTPFNAGNFFDSALELVVRGDMTVSLYDNEATPGALLARAGGGASGWRYAVPVVIAGHRLVVETGEPRNAQLSPLALATLGFGMLVASLLAVVARLVTAQAEEDRVSLGWLREQASIRASLTRELNHRVKNTLASVLAIIALTRGRATGLDDFVEGLQGRIRALSATHDLLTQRDWGATPLRAVIAAELAPFTHGGDNVVDLEGPEVMLAPNDALSLGLAVHELATNASKYGALSVHSGQVKASWALVQPDLVRVEWRESGGPPVASEPPRGFGTELIERIVAHELGRKVDLCFAPDGVRCMLLVPVREPATFQIRASR